ncbi:MAG: DUF4167 domain-containing protein [Cohaesibacter sp.]|nr:DUF4167 domain-containing protein [Cohaesibacter sp.]
MRQGQKNNRMRGRGRKPSNPLTRSYDSNGPDVKIRGTASHIAEKYQSLARDASASGDIVMAENYYQHAEHYLRIIASAQVANREQENRPQPVANGSGEQPAQGRGGRRGKPVVVDLAEEAQPEIVEIAEAAPAADESTAAPAADAEGAEPVANGAAPAPKEESAPPKRRRRAPARPRKRAAPSQPASDAAEPAAPAPQQVPAAALADAPQPVVADE